MIPIQRGAKILRRGGLRACGVRTLQYLNLWSGLWNTVTSRHQFGTNIFEKEWDLLVVLDACRPDSLREFDETYPWLDQVGQLRSVGSMSAEWTIKTFTEEYQKEIGQTAFVSRNVWSGRVMADRVHEPGNDSGERNFNHVRRGYPAWNPVTPQAFCHYERVQPNANQDDRIHPESTSIPHIVTDRAINVGRTVDCNRLIVWYSMPHIKFFAGAVDWSQDTTTNNLMSGPEPTRELHPEEKSYEPAIQGEVSSERMQELYRENLALVLAYVDILLHNISAEKVVITADHGEGLGEEGIWSHPYGYPWSPIKTVPWAQTTATDENTYTSRFDELDRVPVSEEKREILRDMGYL